MHRCLRVVDILYYILEFVILELWDEDDLWRGYNNYWSLKRPLIDSDWTRFDSYAARIKNLGFYTVEFEDQEQHSWAQPEQLRDYSKYPVSRETLAQLAFYRRRQFLLPNLVQLRWTYLDIHYIAYIPMLLGPNLTALSIGFHPPDNLHSSDDYTPEMYDELAPILEVLVEACPSLTHLAIWAEPEDNVKELSLVFAYGCQHLEGFTVTNPSWSTDILRLIASKPFLRKAFVAVDEEVASDLPSLRSEALRYPFPSLESVYIITQALPAGTELVTLMTTCRLRIFTLDFEARTYPSEVQDLFTALRDRCTKATLQVVNVMTRKKLRDWSLTSDEDALTIDTVTPMLGFSGLRVFRLDIPFMAYINDDELGLMADSWPLLVDFRLQESWGFHMPSEITWAGVAYLVYRCPQLMHLFIALDMSSDNIEEVTSKPDFKPAPYLRHLHVLDSDFCDPEFLACCAHKLSPIFVEILGYGWHEMDDDGEDLPPAQDPVAFFETATEFLWQMQFPDRKREHNNSNTSSVPNWLKSLPFRTERGRGNEPLGRSSGCRAVGYRASDLHRGWR
ncbi:hypothetical protein TRAPUB_11291 [Trametes pubescens]|uniref:F-box domain-containing protein n=1 Tax=Trametes pubescens TaxID=154538 RepID=A0A1M2VX50_TRAPU|nr:hypothetical protein TRAPUB_11291 [Trametes pubescens]